VILVVGAAGNLGRDVVHELASRGIPVRAMYREFADKEEAPPPGVTLVEGDFRKLETLVRALDGVDAAFLVSKEMPGVIEREGAFIEAARRAGTRRIVKLARLFAAPDASSILHRLQWQIVEELRASGVPYTVVRPQAFMQNVLLDAPTIQATDVIYSAMGPARLAYMDRRDVAAAVATVLLEDGHTGEDYAVSGPALLDYAEITAQLAKAIGRPLTCIDVPVEAALQGMLGMGLPGWFAEAYAGIIQFAKEGPPQVLTTKFQDIVGRPPTSFAQFASEQRSAFMPLAAATS